MVALSCQPGSGSDVQLEDIGELEVCNITAVKESETSKSFHQKIKINELDVLYCRCDYCGLLTAVFLLLPAELRGILNAKICDQPAFV